MQQVRARAHHEPDRRDRLPEPVGESARPAQAAAAAQAVAQLLRVVRRVDDDVDPAVGERPTGWLGPWLAETERTPDLLHEAGAAEAKVLIVAGDEAERLGALERLDDGSLRRASGAYDERDLPHRRRECPRLTRNEQRWRIENDDPECLDEVPQESFEF